MKIERPDLSIAKTLDTNRSGNRRTPDIDFKKILDDSINHPAPPKTQSVNAQPSMIDPLAGIKPIPNINSDEGFHKIEALLGVIDDYIQKLGDHKFTLKDLAPIIEKMADKNEVISDFLDSLPDEDELKGIANEALIISSLEITKFNRGDYLDSYLERR